MHNIKVMSREKAIQEINGYKTSVSAVISISDKNQEQPKFENDTNQYLFLNFNDVDRTGKGAMTSADAEKILNFIEEAEKTCCSIVVHCGAGISRSAGIAGAIGKILDNDDSFVFENAFYKPNMHCYGLLMKAKYSIS